MTLPLNGRIAIIDDQIKQAEPIMKVLSSKQLPYTYFSGEVDYLPKEGENYNDIRILFLDINLIDDQERNKTELRGKLIPVLQRVISKENYPYIIVYWSRHEFHKDLIEDDIFKNYLNDREPIAFLSAMKSDYFDLNGTKTDDFEEKIKSLFDKIQSLLDTNPSYSYLLNWENLVHISADNTLQEVFCAHHKFDDWTDNANHLINKLAQSYSGKAFYKDSAPNRIKSAFNSLTYLVNDTLEKNVNSKPIANAKILTTSGSNNGFEPYHSINMRLLFSTDNDLSEYPGAVIEDINPKSEKVFKELLNNLFNRSKIQDDLSDEERKEDDPKKLQKIVDKKCSDVRKLIRDTWKKIYLTTTPLCDYAQNKNEYNRCVKGIIVESEFIKYIDNRSEAIFLTPQFLFEEKSYVLIVHFRYFFTTNKGIKLLSQKPLFRARQQLLAEIQSKLSRHISRQGILFLDDK